MICVVCDQPIGQHVVSTPDGPVDVTCAGVYYWKPGRPVAEIRDVAARAEAAVVELVERVRAQVRE